MYRNSFIQHSARYYIRNIYLKYILSPVNFPTTPILTPATLTHIHTPHTTRTTNQHNKTMLRHVLLLVAAAHCTAQITEGEIYRPCTFSWSFWRDCTAYSLHAYKSTEVDTHLTIANSANTPAQVPSTLHGLFYMDGNQMHDEVVSFANCKWDDSENACHLDVFGSRNWGWTNSDMGEATYKSVRYAELVYKVSFNAARTLASIKPQTVHVGDVWQFLVDFDMYYVDDGLGGMWVRNSSTANGEVNFADYHFRRIVAGDGARTGNWDGYVADINNPEKTLTADQFYAKKQ